MSNSLQILCIKDTEGYWTEGEMYPARIVAGGFVQVGDDDDLNQWRSLERCTNGISGRWLDRLSGRRY